MSQPIVVFNQVSKKFGDFVAVDQVSLTINEGDFFALLGPNGAGKTTLLSILTGLQKATSGTVSVQGFDVVRSYRQARMALGAVPQELVFDPFFTVREALRFQSGYFGITHNDAWIDELLHSLHLQDKANTNSRKLSGGMKRRLMVAQALVHRPPVIVLDEPTAGVDVELRRELWKFIRSLNDQGHTILLTTHYLQEAEELSNRIAMMKAGKVVKIADKELLMHSHSAQTLRLKVQQSIVPYLPPALADSKITEDHGWQTLPIKHADEVEQLLTHLRLAKVPIEEMQINPVDLEEVFLEIVGEHSPY